MPDSTNSFDPVKSETLALFSIECGRSLESIANLLKNNLSGSGPDLAGESEIMEKLRRFAYSYLSFRSAWAYFSRYSFNRTQLGIFRKEESHRLFFLAMRAGDYSCFTDSISNLTHLSGLPNSYSHFIRDVQATNESELKGLYNWAQLFRSADWRYWAAMNYLSRAGELRIGFFKKFFSWALLIAASPLFLAISILVFITMGGPILFSQRRVGRAGEEFSLFKFRTMYTKNQYRKMSGSSEWGGETVANDNRVAPIGRLLRRLKLDEFPQLLNIAAGKMDFVGYRPELPLNVSTVEKDYALLCCYSPGITDRSSLAFIDEDIWLSKLQNRGSENPYQELLLPIKTTTSLKHLVERSRSGGDLAIVLQTIVQAFFMKNRGSADNLPKPVDYEEIYKEAGPELDVEYESLSLGELFSQAD